MEVVASDSSADEGAVDLSAPAQAVEGGGLLCAPSDDEPPQAAEGGGLECGPSDDEPPQAWAEEVAPAITCPGDELDISSPTQMDDAWQPGVTAGPWFQAGSRVTPQCQVLMTNLVLGLRSLPGQLRKSLCAFLPAQGSTAKKQRGAPALDAAARLLRLSYSRIWRTFAGVRANGWRPVDAGGSPAPTASCREEQPDPRGILLTLVRTALGARTARAPGMAYKQALARLALEGVPIGDKYHTEEFMNDAVFLAARNVQASDVTDLAAPLAGLGIPSDFAILMDGLPVGGVSLYGRHGSVSAICVCTVSPHTHRLHAPLLTWYVADRGHGGEATANAVLNAFVAEPFGLSCSDLEQRVCLVGGDGAIVRGGPGRPKPGTQAAEILWAKVHRCTEDLGEGLRGAEWVDDAQRLHRCTEWDKFHREDLANNRAVAETPMAWEVYDVCRLMDTLFNLGDGSLILRRAAQEVGEQPSGA